MEGNALGCEVWRMLIAEFLFCHLPCTAQKAFFNFIVEDVTFFNVCVLEMSFILLKNYYYQFIGVCDFTPEFAWFIYFCGRKISVFHASIGLDDICWRNFEVVIGIKNCWMGRLEGSFGMCMLHALQILLCHSGRFPWRSCSSANHAGALQLGQGCIENP